MVNQDDVVLLRQGVHDWNSWRASASAIIPESLRSRSNKY